MKQGCIYPLGRAPWQMWRSLFKSYDLTRQPTGTFYHGFLTIEYSMRTKPFEKLNVGWVSVDQVCDWLEWFDKPTCDFWRVPRIKYKMMINLSHVGQSLRFEITIAELFWAALTPWRCVKIIYCEFQLTFPISSASINTAEGFIAF